MKYYFISYITPRSAIVMYVCDTRTRQILLVGCVRALFIHLIDACI